MITKIIIEIQSTGQSQDWLFYNPQKIAVISNTKYGNPSKQPNGTIYQDYLTVIRIDGETIELTNDDFLYVYFDCGKSIFFCCDYVNDCLSSHGVALYHCIHENFDELSNVVESDK